MVRDFSQKTVQELYETIRVNVDHFRTFTEKTCNNSAESPGISCNLRKRDRAALLNYKCCVVY